MKSFISLILEQEEPESFKFDDIKYKKKGVDQAKDVVGPAKYSAAAQKQKGTSKIDDVLQRNLAKADKQFGDMLDRAGIQPEEIHKGIDPHSGELETTRQAKAEAKTAERKVKSEMRSAAKLTPKDIAKLKKIESRPGVQRSLGILGKEDLEMGYRQAFYDDWKKRTHIQPTRVSMSGTQQPIRSGSIEVPPKTSKDPNIIRTSTRPPVRQTPKDPGLLKRGVRLVTGTPAGQAARLGLKVGGKALGAVGAALAPITIAADADEIATKLTGYEKEEMERRRRDPNRSLTASNLTTFVRSPGTKF